MCMNHVFSSIQIRKFSTFCTFDIFFFDFLTFDVYFSSFFLRHYVVRRFFFRYFASSIFCLFDILLFDVLTFDLLPPIQTRRFKIWPVHSVCGVRYDTKIIRFSQKASFHNLIEIYCRYWVDCRFQFFGCLIVSNWKKGSLRTIIKHYMHWWITLIISVGVRIYCYCY
jgi:hypothetical protein